MAVTTLQLKSGDQVLIGMHIVRTVREVVDSGCVANGDQTLYNVWYREGSTAEWSAGNSGTADSEWVVVGSE